jgi:regulator of protease activity HflC (stomatin/prohibitin superfamily)
MADFLRLLLDAIQFIWPLRLVKQWQRGGYYVFGRWWKEVGPGVYPVVPWFSDVQEVDVAEEIVTGRRQDVTLADGTLLSFIAAATIKVVDVRAALNDVQEYAETARESVEAVLADRLATMDVTRLDADERGRLLGALKRGVQAELTPYGVELCKLRFTAFIVNAKAHRIVMETT